MPDTMRTLAALQTLLADNTTNLITPQHVRDMLVSTYALDYSEELAITAAATATIGKWHLCTGTTADYELALPAAAGNAGRMIGVRMGTTTTLTKLVTLNANGTEKIDGAETRVMHSNEVAVLKCDGANWFKIGGKSIPLFAHAVRNTAQAIANATVVPIVFNSTISQSNSGIIGSDQFNILRPGKYQFSGLVSYEAIGSGSAGKETYCVLGKNTKTIPDGVIAPLTVVPSSLTGSNMYAHSAVSSGMDLALNDYVALIAYQDSGVSCNTRVAVSYVKPFMIMLEVPSW